MPECDVFLSYSWNDDPTGPFGESWVKQFRALLERDLERSLGRKPDIFLDQSDIPNGPVVSSLRPKLEDAKAFVGIVSDGWLNEESWCRWELSHFRSCACLDREHPDHRIFKVLLGPISEGTRLPGELSHSPDYRFFSYGGRDQHGRPNSFGVSDLQGVSDYKRLLGNLVALLRVSQDRTWQREITVYIADAPSTDEWQARRDRLCMDLRKNGIRPACEVRWPGVTAGHLEGDIRTRIQMADASVHLLAHSANAAGWDRTQAETELAVALEITERVDREPLPIFLWSDSKDASQGDWSGLIERAATVRPVDNLVGKTWEYALSNIQARISSKCIPGEAAHPPLGSDGASVFVQCIEEDRPFARTIRERLGKKGHRVDFLPQPKGWIFRKRRTSEDERRQQNYERYYRRSDGLLVLHGNGNATELWSLENCDAIRACLKGELDGKVRGVCLAPPEETKDFQDVDFPSFPNYYLSRLDEFEKKLPRQKVSHA